MSDQNDLYMISRRAVSQICVICVICGLFLSRLLDAQIIDDFDASPTWVSAPSDGVSLDLRADAGHEGRALRMDFDFQGHGGYAVARKKVNLDLPDNYAFTFWIRGEAPVNNLEFKLIDSTGDNVWWMNQRNFTFPRGWKKVTIRRRQIEFAWGPLGGGTAHHLAAIELAITAGTGGKGSIWIDQFALEPRPPDRPYDLVPLITASSSGDRHGADLAIDDDSLSAWRSAAGDEHPWIALDFRQNREFGGLTLEWDPASVAAEYQVQLSDDGERWSTAYSAHQANGGRDYVFLPESESRYLRVLVLEKSADTLGLRAIHVQPLEWAATRNAFLQSIADDALRGHYPRYLTGRQSYWTIVGVNGDGDRGLLGQDGAFEPVAGGFSIEPFLRLGDRTCSWADGIPRQSLEHGYLPIPSVSRNCQKITLTVTAFAAGPRAASSAFTRYRVVNTSTQVEDATLYLAVRPLQVNPPWQFLGVAGGAARIDSVEFRENSLWVNGARRIDVAAPAEFGASTFDQGDISEFLFRGATPTATSAHDPMGLISGAFTIPLTLAPGAARDIYLRFPLTDETPATRVSALEGNAALERTTRYWDTLLNRTTVDLPPSGQRFEDALRTNLAYMLINRDGPGIEPGARSYRRSWIRDGAMIGSALLRMGQPEPVREFISWFAPYQYESGKVPCCVDSRGADPVPEHDSHGELIYIIAEYYRATGDRAYLESLWPHVAAAVAYIDSLRQTRRTPEYQSGKNLTFFGLMPPSISHEGYSARPVHSYWDDFFVLRGLIDAADIAKILDHDPARFASIRDEFRHDLHQSIRATIADDSLDYIPGSADLGDYDPTSTSIGITPGGQADGLPADILAHTYQRYMREVRARGDSTGWEAYTPYEFRNVGAMVQLGLRAEAWELLQILFEGRRPAAWNQWPEVVHRDSTAPKFIGDLPHTWVGSDYVRSMLDMLAYVQEADSTIIIGAGIPRAWVMEDPGVSVRNLRVASGKLAFTMKGDDRRVIVRLNGTLAVPPGGLLVYPPFDWKAGAVTVDGAAADLRADGSVLVRRLPGVIVFAPE
ncbi:MAG: discoidin domain-containing protein [Gemmatimonadota bacterium]